MDDTLTSVLPARRISDDTVKVMEEEGVVSLAIFSSLREEHFEKLLPKLTVGQHAMVLRLWDRQNSCNWRGHDVVSEAMVRDSTMLYGCRLDPLGYTRLINRPKCSYFWGPVGDQVACSGG